MKVSGEKSIARCALRKAKRVVIKAGTSVVTSADGLPSLVRIGSITEQVSQLVKMGKEVIIVSSGAVGMGRKLLKKQMLLNSSLKDHVSNTDLLASGNPGKPSVAGKPAAGNAKNYDSACAAAGQFGLMNVYNMMFDQRDLSASQLLLTQHDFQDAGRLKNLAYCVENLLALGVIPIINENDAVSANQGYTASDVFSDNDSLAALCARSFNAEVLLLLTDVSGVYDRPPSEPGAFLLPFYYDYVDPSTGVRHSSSDHVQIGAKSLQGRGGMGAKIDAAMSAVRVGSQCQACVIAAGWEMDSISSVLGAFDGKCKGTLFLTPGSDLFSFAVEEAQGAAAGGAEAGKEQALAESRAKALKARDGARAFRALPYERRCATLHAIADALLQGSDGVLAENELDVKDAEAAKTLDQQNLKRLKLTKDKIAVLAAGIKQIANNPVDPLGVVKKRTEVSETLDLTLVTVPIGVLLVIFESRPDSLPQIACLSLASGNGLLLKGGKEAARSNLALHKLIGDAIEASTGGLVSRDVVALITSRSEISDLLSLDDCIDLVIPRGGNALVSHIKSNTRIPVLGHADGVCHVYIDSSCDVALACQLCVDSKCDYPAACNAAETFLFHEKTVSDGRALAVIRALRVAGVKCFGGPNAMKEGLCDVPATSLRVEYSALECLIEVVKDLDEAVSHIHAHGSGHTECIITSSDEAAARFIDRVDSACVFHNASTRFADGYRFGLGAEVGISTGKIHARGPVGVEGLLTTKYVLRSKGGDAVGEYGEKGPKVYTHVKKDL